jgi:hypothetical protein
MSAPLSVPVPLAGSLAPEAEVDADLTPAPGAREFRPAAALGGARRRDVDAAGATVTVLLLLAGVR